MKVSCLMVSCWRLEFVPLAIRYFLAQTYEDRELVIYETSGARGALRGLVPTDDPRIRLYEKHGYEERALGDLRNTAADLAAGELLAHWDDDDVSHPRRLADQVALLSSSGADLVGYRSMMFLDERRKTDLAWWRYDGVAGYAIGTSFLYRRELWRRQPFLSKNVGEDNSFLEGAAVESVDGTAPVRMVARVHRKSTSPHVFAGEAWRPAAAEEIAEAEELLK